MASDSHRPTPPPPPPNPKQGVVPEVIRKGETPPAKGSGK